MGYVGLLTGLRKGRVSVSVDTRFDDNYDKYFIHWLENAGEFRSWITRGKEVAAHALFHAGTCIPWAVWERFVACSCFTSRVASCPNG